MTHIRESAESCVRNLLKTTGIKAKKKTGSPILISEDYMDDGSVIKLKVDINIQNGSAVFDFELVYGYVFQGCIQFVTNISISKKSSKIYGTYYNIQIYLHYCYSMVVNEAKYLSQIILITSSKILKQFMELVSNISISIVSTLKRESFYKY